LLLFVAMIGRLKFKTSASGLESILGELERPIMEAVWAKGEVAVAEVLPLLDGEPAYTTVKTVMERLEKKGLLKRVREGRAYRYAAAVSRSDLEGNASRQVVDGLLAAFGNAAIAQFAEAMREDPEKLAELRRVLAALPDDEESVR
jgi:BlaI family penicillinase repressor